MGKHSLSFAGRLQLIKSVLMSLNVYWAMAFILPKGVIREAEKKMRTFLWKGNSAVGYPKVAWSAVCKPIEEGGQGILDILALNKALMSRHLWNVIQNNQSSIWPRLLDHTISESPGRTNIPEAAKLSRDSILWRGWINGYWALKFWLVDSLAVFSLLTGLYKCRVGPGGVCVLWVGGMETHEHLFFRCNYSRQCIRILKGTVRFTWSNRAWAVDIAWASKRWNGRHIVQAAYRALLAAIVYHIWQEVK
ncbi:putative ribonuclease H protein [Sesamum angolense]|uniref:Ribonuclease H protein n=1 Tax=Sesamum angolense TaxID=2727404 RepID=A0AAE1T8M7_9LAMI|nr:putative ribonuclease H protein [Sesamum angolense]